MVESAQEMYDAVLSRFAEADIVIKSAAVADYRPKTMLTTRLKNSLGNKLLNLKEQRIF